MMICVPLQAGSGSDQAWPGGHEITDWICYKIPAGNDVPEVLSSVIFREITTFCTTAAG